MGFASQVISLIIDFYASISWLSSENGDVAILTGEWKTMNGWIW